MADATTEQEVEEPSEPEPAAPPQPMSVGRMFADAIRRAGSAGPSRCPARASWACSRAWRPSGSASSRRATRRSGVRGQAHAQLTGRPAVCIGTRAVGATNLAIGIHAAYADSSPMFAFVGQVERAARGEGFQEIDVTETVGRLAKWSAEPTDVTSAVKRLGRQSSRHSTGGPGRWSCRCPRISSTKIPAGVAPLLGRVPPPRPTDDQVRDVLHLRRCGAAGDPGRRGRASGTDFG